MNNMRYLIGFYITILFFSCAENKRIEITNEYIINENWDESIIVCVEQMKVKEGHTANIFDPNFDLNQPNHWNIVNSLETDSTATIYNYFQEKKFSSVDDKMLFFDKNNGVKWRKGCHGLNEYAVEIIGVLKKDTWYKFSKLKTKPYFIYIYVDSTGSTHSFKQDLSNM